MRSIQRLGFAATLFATCAFAYACSGSDSGDLLSPNDGTPSGEDGSADDDATTDRPDGDTLPDEDATPPQDAGDDDATAQDGGHDADDGDDADVDAGEDAGGPIDVTFFVTSVGNNNGGNFGGLAGADKFCQDLADDAKLGEHKWHAYLSTTKQNNGGGATKAVHAKNRIGTGPWRNAKGKIIANNVAQLHAPNFELTVDDALDEKGQSVPLTDRTIFTGTNPDGMAATDNCSNWTAGGLTDVQGAAGVLGGGADAKASWNGGAKTSCATNAIPIAKPGRIYCFATD